MFENTKGARERIRSNERPKMPSHYTDKSFFHILHFTGCLSYGAFAASLTLAYRALESLTMLALVTCIAFCMFFQVFWGQFQSGKYRHNAFFLIGLSQIAFILASLHADTVGFAFLSLGLFALFYTGMHNELNLSSKCQNGIFMRDIFIGFIATASLFKAFPELGNWLGMNYMGGLYLALCTLSLLGCSFFVNEYNQKIFEAKITLLNKHHQIGE